MLEGKLTAARKRWLKKLVKTFFFFLVFTSSLAGVFVKLKPPLKISRSATDYIFTCALFSKIFFKEQSLNFWEKITNSKTVSAHI